MKKVSFQRLAQRSKIHLRKASPTILSCLGAIGVVITSVMAVRATPNALRKIRTDSCEKHNGDPDAYGKLEAVQSAWVCYIPTVISGTATIFCIFGASILSKKQQAAITSAYALLNDSYNTYKGKLKELYGDETHQKIVDAIAAGRAKDVYISANGFCESTSLSFDERNPDDMRLFYDTFSKRYFEGTIIQVLEAEYHLNRNWTLGAGVCVNDFYNFLGIEPIDGGNELGWFYEDGIGWIDFNHRKTVLEDGLEVYVIDMVYTPTLEDA